MSFGLALTASANHQQDWLDQFGGPFEPHVELVRNGEVEFLCLKSARLDGMTTPGEIYQAGKQIVRELNAIVAGIFGESSVNCIGAVEFKEDGTIARHLFMEVEPIKIRARARAVGVALDKDGNVIVQPPAATAGNNAFRAANLSQPIADALTYLAGAPQWFELYKAFECLRDHALLAESGETRRFTHTANAAARHRRGKYEPPKDPMSLDDALALLRSLINDAINSVLAANR